MGRAMAWRLAAAACLGLSACARVEPASVEADLPRLAVIEAAFPGGVETVSVRFGRAAQAADYRIEDDQVQRLTAKTVSVLRRGDNANTPADAVSGPVYGELSRAAKSLATTKASLAVCAQDEPQLRSLTRFLTSADVDARFARPTTTPTRLAMLKRYLRANVDMSPDEQRGVLSIRGPSRQRAAAEVVVVVDPERRALVPGTAPLRCAQLVVSAPDAG